MIRKLLLGLFLFLGLGISFSSAYHCNEYFTYCYDLQFGEYINNNGYKGAVSDKNLNFNNLIFDYWSGDNRFFSYWWELDGLHYTEQTKNFSNGRNGNVYGYFSCDNRPSLSNGNLEDYCIRNNSFSGLQDKLSDDDRYLFYCKNFNTGNPIQCTVCSYNSNSVNSGNYTCLYKYSYGANTQEFLTDEQILYSATINPYSNNEVYIHNGSGIELYSNESAINYYETYYGWDEGICYVGVDNLTSLYGSGGVSFNKGRGLSIFETFSGLYGNTDLDKMYVWMNTWLINYGQWFGRETPLYLANYNSGTNQVDLYYDNLTFPFANKPVALYFMADNINSYSWYDTMGSSVVSYCNIKINGGSFNDIIDEADKYNITAYTEQYNRNKGLNPDGSVKGYDAFLSSGTELAFSGDLSIKNTIKELLSGFSVWYDNFEIVSVGSGSQTRGNNRSLTNGFLPSWLITAFMFVVLFKLIRKK